MYQKITDKLDVLLLKEFVDEEYLFVTERIMDIIDTLDGAYGENRTSGDMGGFVLLFRSYEDYKKLKEKILSFYRIESGMKEYYDVLNDVKNNRSEMFIEEMYLMGAENAIIFMYPQDNEDIDYF